MAEAGCVYTLRLSWPAPALWQNRRTHWSQRSRATSVARYEAWGAAVEAGMSGIAWRSLAWQTPTLVFAFHPPDGRRRDLQNMPATQKATIDGIAQAMGCDDAGFRCVWPSEWAERVKGGAVVVEVSE